MKYKLLLVFLLLITSSQMQSQRNKLTITLEDINNYNDELEDNSSIDLLYSEPIKEKTREEKLKLMADPYRYDIAEGESNIMSSEEYNNLMNRLNPSEKKTKPFALFILSISILCACLCYIIAIYNNLNIYKCILLGVFFNIIGVILCLYLKNRNSIISNTYTKKEVSHLSLPYMLRITAALILFFGLFSMPIGYYTFLRIIISGIAAYNAMHYFNKTNILFIYFLLLTVLYNPIIPIVLHKDHWIILNITTLILGYIITVQKK